MPLQGVAEFDIPLGDEDIPVLDVPRLVQVGDEWCWATCAQMISAYYGAALAQCQIVKIHIGTDCCDPQASPQVCDVPLPSAQVEVVYDELGLKARLLPNLAGFAVLLNEIAAGRPVQVGLQREDGTAHLVVVVGAGMLDGREWVKFNDPLGGEAASLSYDDLLALGAAESWIGIGV